MLRQTDRSPPLNDPLLSIYAHITRSKNMDEAVQGGAVLGGRHTLRGGAKSSKSTLVRQQERPFLSMGTAGWGLAQEGAARNIEIPT